jgi:signal transduction histidine kinase
MPSLICSGGLQPSATRTSDGRLWFPTSKGLAVINPADVKPNSLPPPVVIESILANGHAQPWDHHAPAPLRLAPGWQRLEFHYAGLSFIAPEEMRFQCRLEGLEKNWVDAGNKRVAEYNYLPPGNYTFHVRACNSDGVWNESGAVLPFTVLPHFWQRFWFRAVTSLAIALLLAGVVFWGVRRRLHRRLEAAQRLQAIERERTRIAKDIHDHLGANLTRISLLSQSAQGDLANPTEVAAHLDRIYGTARELTRAMDEIVWAVNPQHDTLDSLASYLGNFAQDYLAPLHIRCRLEMPLQLPHWPITAETRHNVFLAFKEALHNVVKHSGAEEVSIFLTPEADRFTLIVRDNGKGFDPKAVRHRAGRGNGLKNMAQRLEKIGGRCEIQSHPGSRTEITFSVAVSQINGT